MDVQKFSQEIIQNESQQRLYCRRLDHCFFALFFELGAHADESDLATTINFSQPVQIPGQVLPAGTYLFKLVDGNSDQKVVQIFNADRTVLYATLQTIAADQSGAPHR